MTGGNPARPAVGRTIASMSESYAAFVARHGRPATAVAKAYRGAPLPEPKSTVEKPLQQPRNPSGAKRPRKAGRSANMGAAFVAKTAYDGFVDELGSLADVDPVGKAMPPQLAAALQAKSGAKPAGGKPAGGKPSPFPPKKGKQAPSSSSDDDDDEGDEPDGDEDDQNVSVKKRTLDAAARRRMPAKSFAGPGRSFPMNDKTHARLAVQMASHASPATRARIKAKAKKMGVDAPSLGKAAPPRKRKPKPPRHTSAGADRTAAGAFRPGPAPKY